MFLPAVVRATLLLYFVLLPSVCPAETQHKVFFVHSYGADNVCGQPQERGILAGLVQRGYVQGENLLLEHFYMESKARYTSDEQISRRGLDALAAIRAWQPEVVVTLDDNAAKTVMLPLVDSPIPVIFSGINNRPEEYNRIRCFMENRKRPGHNVTGVYERLPVVQSLRVMHEVLPNLKKCIILGDDSPTGRAIRQQVARELSGTGRNIAYSFWLAHDFDEYKQMIRRINSDPDIGTYYMASSRLDNGSSSVVTVPEITAWTLAHATKPAMAVNYSAVRLGFFGGASVDFSAMGEMVADKIAAILDGAHAGTLPVEDARADGIVFNLARARQLGISIPVDLFGAADQVFDSMELGSPFILPDVLVVHSVCPSEEEAQLEKGALLQLEQAGWVADRTFTLHHQCLHLENTTSRETLSARGRALLDTIKRLDPEAVLLFGDASAATLIPSLLDTKQQVLFAGVHAPKSFYLQKQKTGRDPEKTVVANVSGVTSPFSLQNNLQTVRLLFPEARQVAVISFDFWPWLSAVNRDFAAETADYADGLDRLILHRVHVATMEGFQEAVLRFVSDPAIDVLAVLLPVGKIPANGEIKSRQQLIEWLFIHQDKAEFSFSADTVRQGFLISSATDSLHTGRQLGKQLIRILAGETAAAIPIERATGTGLFINQARAKQLGMHLPVEFLEAASKVYTRMEFTSNP